LGTNYNGIKSSTEIKIICPTGTNSTEAKFIKTRLEGDHLFFEFELTTNKISEFCALKPTNCGIDTRNGRIDFRTL
jgi:hypothetical protein